MLLLHFLDTLVIFLLNEESIFLHFFLYKQLYTHHQTYKTIFNKYNLKHNITLLKSIAHGFFNILTAEMVNDLNETQNKKPKNTLLKSKSLDNFSDTSTNLINHSTALLPLHLSIRNVLTNFRCPNLNYFRNDTTFLTPKITLRTSTVPFSSEQHPSLPNISNKNSHPNDNLATPHDTLTNAPVTSNTDTPIKIYSRINYPFPSPSS